MKITYNSDHDQVSYGYYQCRECDASFYGGGKALHKRSCTQTTYSGTEYVIGPKCLASLKEWGEKFGEDRRHALMPITLNEVREQLPELFPKEEGA